MYSDVLAETTPIYDDYLLSIQVVYVLDKLKLIVYNARLWDKTYPLLTYIHEHILPHCSSSTLSRARPESAVSTFWFKTYANLIIYRVFIRNTNITLYSVIPGILLKNEPDLESRKAVISWISLMRIWILYFCRSIKTSEWRKRQSSGTMTIKTNRIRKGIRHKIITQLSFYDSTWNRWNKTQHKEL